MRFRQILEAGSTLVIAVVAVVMAFAYFQDRNAAPGARNESPRLIRDWERENALGIRKGPAGATVVITEFIDFECPYCAALAPTVDSIAEEFPEAVAVVFQHFPLPSHEYAVPAAIAAECADRQGRFWPMVRLLLAGQETLGSLPWERFAENAGVSELAAFSECVKLPADSFPRIRDGRSVGKRTGVTGTPTTWINGRVMRPTEEAVRTLLK
jgi:protein-disulfide isomerase